MNDYLRPNDTHPDVIEGWLTHHLGLTLTPQQREHLRARRAARLATANEVPPSARTNTRITSATRVINATEHPTHPTTHDEGSTHERHEP